MQSSDYDRILTELVTTRMLKSDFDSGDLPADPSPEDLSEFYSSRLASELVGDAVWKRLSDVVSGWEEREKEANKPILNRVFERFSRLPTVDRVREVLGQDRGDAYKTAREEIEQDTKASSLMPSETSAYPWRKFDMDAAVSAIVDVVAPNLDKPESNMRAVYDRLLWELRARRRERVKMSSAAGIATKKETVRSLGIWFPITKDIPRWNSDPRTRDDMPEFLSVMSKVVNRMRTVRSYLQYVPRRRLSPRACADLPVNLERMRAYMRGDVAITLGDDEAGSK